MKHFIFIFILFFSTQSFSKNQQPLKQFLSSDPINSFFKDLEFTVNYDTDGDAAFEIQFHSKDTFWNSSEASDSCKSLNKKSLIASLKKLQNIVLSNYNGDVFCNKFNEAIICNEKKFKNLKKTILKLKENQTKILSDYKICDWYKCSNYYCGEGKIIEHLKSKNFIFLGIVFEE